MILDSKLQFARRVSFSLLKFKSYSAVKNLKLIKLFVFLVLLEK